MPAWASSDGGGPALHCCGDLRAVIIVEQSDVAINLSDLLNGFKVLVIEPKTHPENHYQRHRQSDQGRRGKIRSLDDFIRALIARSNSLYNEKEYYLWILNVQHGTPI